MILQLLIFVCSCSAIALLAQQNARWRRWGFVIGLAGQPAWLISSLQAELYGIAAVACWFTFWYAYGIWKSFAWRRLE